MLLFPNADPVASGGEIEVDPHLHYVIYLELRNGYAQTKPVHQSKQLSFTGAF